MQIRLLQEDEDVALDRFVAAHPRGAIEQTWGWGVLQTSIPGRPDFFVLGVFEGQLIASALFIRQEMAMGKTWLWCPRGPLLPMTEDGKFADDAEEVWRLLEEECRKLALEKGDVFLRVESGYLSSDSEIIRGKASSQAYLPEHTLILNLEHGEDAILKQMAQKGRYHIKQAEKHGVAVLKSDFHDFEDFYELLAETAKRDGFYLHSKNYYLRFLDALGEQVRLYVARIDHTPIGGILVTHFGDTATYYYGASSSKHGEYKAPYALQWFAIQEAKRLGMKTYDFLGIAPDDQEGSRAAVAGHPLAGVTQFKTRFGGERLQYQKAQVFIYRPLWWHLSNVLRKLDFRRFFR